MELTYPDSGGMIIPCTKEEVLKRETAILRLLDAGEKKTSDVEKHLSVSSSTAHSILKRLRRHGRIKRRLARMDVAGPDGRMHKQKIAIWSLA